VSADTGRASLNSSLDAVLRGAAERWARAAAEAYLDDADHDLALHHMAVAVELLAKAYLCSVSPTLIALRPDDTDDVLALLGRTDLTDRRAFQVQTITGSQAMLRCVSMIEQQGLGPLLDPKDLREARNGVAHIGQWRAADADGRDQHCLSLFTRGVKSIETLLEAMGADRILFWGGRWWQAIDRLLAGNADPVQLRYDRKVQKARMQVNSRHPAIRTRHLSAQDVVWRDVWNGQLACPVCQRAAHAIGRISDADPRMATVVKLDCPSCGLELTGPELEFAGRASVDLGLPELAADIAHGFGHLSGDPDLGEDELDPDRAKLRSDEPERP